MAEQEKTMADLVDLGADPKLLLAIQEQQARDREIGMVPMEQLLREKQEAFSVGYRKGYNDARDELARRIFGEGEVELD